ncbi:MAG: DUF1232 domain-containing protein [Lentisphaerae bacterium]|nr:DUF1232 domain-containing protein [Lentisphaerota bacterium]
MKEKSSTAGKTGQFIRFLEDCRWVVMLLNDYRKGNYRSVPWRFTLVLAGAIIYCLIPLDLIPDFIPVAGWLDDGGMLALVFAVFRGELVRYKVWKRRQENLAEK